MGCCERVQHRTSSSVKDLHSRPGIGSKCLWKRCVGFTTSGLCKSLGTYTETNKIREGIRR